MPEEPESLEKLQARIRDLEHDLRTVRHERTVAQRQAALLPTLRVAAERASRDRSAGSTPEVEALRDRVQSAYDTFVEACASLDNQVTLSHLLFRGVPGLADINAPARHRALVEEFLAAVDNEQAWRVAAAEREDVRAARIDIPTAATPPAPAWQRGDA